MGELVEQEGGTRSSRILFSELRKLHIRVGEPSSREVASAIGGMSHTTVNSAIRARRIPSWPVLSKIVAQLGGDENFFRGLWSATREEGLPSDRLASPVAASRPAVSVFVSYASIDNRATHGRIEEIVQSVSDMYESMTGEKVGIFLDKSSLSAGENWRDSIKYELSSSAIFLAFISPSYVKSVECNKEFWEFYRFLESNSSERLIVPLLFGERNRTMAAAPDTELWSVASQLQMIDINDLRVAEPGRTGWLEKAESIAAIIDAALRSVKHRSNIVVDPAAADHDDDVVVPMLLEQMLQFEQSAPSLMATMEGLTDQFHRIGSSVSVAGPVMKRATTTKRRLSVARQLARTLDPIVTETDSSVDSLMKDLKVWDVTVQAVFDYLRRQDAVTAQLNSVVGTLQSVHQMAIASIDAFSQAEIMHNSIGQGRGLSRELDIPLKKLQAAMLRLADSRAMFATWRDGANDFLTAE